MTSTAQLERFRSEVPRWCNYCVDYARERGITGFSVRLIDFENCESEFHAKSKLAFTRQHQKRRREG